MVKRTILFFSLLNLELSFAQEIKGNRMMVENPNQKKSFVKISEKSICYTATGDTERMVTYDFDSSGKYLEMTSYHWKGRTPCRGKELFLMGKRWLVDIKNDEEIILTLDDARVVLSDESSIEYFNEKEFCGNTNWKTNEIVPCDGKKFIYHQREIGFKETINIKSID